MKKSLLAVLLSAVMVASILTGCGDAKEAPAKETTEATEEVKEEKEEVKEEAAEDTTEEAATEEEVSEEAAYCSDEVFAALQEDYAILIECRDEAAAIYNDESVAEDEEITALFNETDEVVAELGEITQDQITDEDALELEDSINDLIEAYSLLVDGMEAAE